MARTVCFVFSMTASRFETKAHFLLTLPRNQSIALTILTPTGDPACPHTQGPSFRDDRRKRLRDAVGGA